MSSLPSTTEASAGRWRALVRRGAVLGVAATLSVALCLPAHAQTPPTPTPTPAPTPPPAQPWRSDVTPEQMQQAGALYNTARNHHLTGNAAAKRAKLLEEADPDNAKLKAEEAQREWDLALAGYRESLQNWDNPTIHLALTQIYLERKEFLEAEASLQRANRSDWRSHLVPKELERVRALGNQLDNYLAPVTVKSTQPGVLVTLDGKEIVTTSEAEHKVRVLPGVRALRASKPEYEVLDREVVLEAGKHSDIDIDLLASDDMAHITVSCVEEQAEILFSDGPGKETWLISPCPGEKTQRLPPEREYTYAIKRPGRIGQETTVTPKRKERIDVALRTKTLKAKAKLKLPRWQPLAVIGTGLAIGVAGGVLQYRAVETMAEYDSDIDARCGTPLTGCPPEILPTEVHDKKSRAERDNKLGVGFMITGLVGVLAGVGLVVYNSPRATSTTEFSEPKTAVVPTITREGVGVAARLRF